MSSDIEDGESGEEPVYVSTHSRDLLPPDFLLHFDGDVPAYNHMTKSLIEEVLNTNEVTSVRHSIYYSFSSRPQIRPHALHDYTGMICLAQFPKELDVFRDKR